MENPSSLILGLRGEAQKALDKFDQSSSVQIDEEERISGIQNPEKGPRKAKSRSEKEEEERLTALAALPPPLFLSKVSKNQNKKTKKGLHSRSLCDGENQIRVNKPGLSKAQLDRELAKLLENYKPVTSFGLKEILSKHHVYKLQKRTSKSKAGISKKKSARSRTKTQEEPEAKLESWTDPFDPDSQQVVFNMEIEKDSLNRLRKEKKDLENLDTRAQTLKQISDWCKKNQTKTISNSVYKSRETVEVFSYKQLSNNALRVRIGASCQNQTSITWKNFPHDEINTFFYVSRFKVKTIEFRTHKKNATSFASAKTQEESQEYPPVYRFTWELCVDRAEGDENPFTVQLTTLPSEEIYLNFEQDLKMAPELEKIPMDVKSFNQQINDLLIRFSIGQKKLTQQIEKIYEKAEREGRKAGLLGLVGEFTACELNAYDKNGEMNEKKRIECYRRVAQRNEWFKRVKSLKEKNSKVFPNIDKEFFDNLSSVPSNKLDLKIPFYGSFAYNLVSGEITKKEKPTSPELKDIGGGDVEGDDDEKEKKDSDSDDDPSNLNPSDEKEKSPSDKPQKNENPLVDDPDENEKPPEDDPENE